MEGSGNRRSVDPEEFLSGIPVEDLSEWIEPVSPSDPVSEIICRLTEQVEDLFPVVEEGDLVGVVSGTDLAVTLRMPSKPSGLTPTSVTALKKHLGHTADDLMTPDPMTIEEGETVWRAVDLMVNYEFRNVPVTVGDELKGVLSMRDVLVHYERKLEGSL